ncbi:MAG: sigma 54-interacting transcriptional regulator [Rhodospirillaceae bacterium]
MSAVGTAEWAPALAGSLEPAIVVDGNGRILHANRRFVFSAASRGRTIGRYCFEVCHLATGHCPEEDCPLGASSARMPIRRSVHVHRTAGVDRLTRVVARPLTDAPSPTYLMAFRALNHVSAVPHRTSLVGRSPAFCRMIEQMDRVAEAPIPLLIVGEPGTGKELVARTLHRMSGHAREPFVVVDCPVADSALAGPGNDTVLLGLGGLLGRAGRGTLFVDNLLAMTPFQQTLLLRLIDATMNRAARSGRPAGPGPRVIAASETAFAALPPGSAFRADLADTLSIYPIDVPPLRDRTEDIPLLAESVLLRLSVTTGRAWHLSPAAAALLQQRDYPGNVRELAYVVERAALISAGGELRPADLLQAVH